MHGQSPLGVNDHAPLRDFPQAVDGPIVLDGDVASRLEAVRDNAGVASVFEPVTEPLVYRRADDHGDGDGRRPDGLIVGVAFP